MTSIFMEILVEKETSNVLKSLIRFIGCNFKIPPPFIWSSQKLHSEQIPFSHEKLTFFPSIQLPNKLSLSICWIFTVDKKFL